MRSRSPTVVRRSFCGVRRHIMALVASAATMLASDHLTAAPPPKMNVSGNGMFVSFNGGLLTLKGKSGHLVYDDVGENYKCYQNNEEGPGSRLVSTVKALSGEKLPGKITPLTRVLPGTMVRVDVETKEIFFGFDHRIIGTFVAYRGGTLQLRAADVEPGFVQIPAGELSLSIDPSLPVLESIDADYLRYVGKAEEKLKTVRPGTVVTLRSHYDLEVFEVVELGVPTHRLERYIGQNRGPVRGAFASFQDGILRIHAKGIGAQAADEYEQLVVRRVAADIPISESVDGGPYQPAGLDALKRAQEGTIITIRKVEDVILAIEVGLPK